MPPRDSCILTLRLIPLRGMGAPASVHGKSPVPWIFGVTVSDKASSIAGDGPENGSSSVSENSSTDRYTGTLSSLFPSSAIFEGLRKWLRGETQKQLASLKSAEPGTFLHRVKRGLEAYGRHRDLREVYYGSVPGSVTARKTLVLVPQPSPHGRSAKSDPFPVIAETVGALCADARASEAHFRRWTVLSTLCLPFSGALFVLPGPNVFFAYNAFRLHANYSAWKGTQTVLSALKEEDGTRSCDVSLVSTKRGSAATGPLWGTVRWRISTQLQRRWEQAEIEIADNLCREDEGFGSVESPDTGSKTQGKDSPMHAAEELAVVLGLPRSKAFFVQRSLREL
eukprot:Clim_evm6s162 gene=Clim_evmTU6s162